MRKAEDILKDLAFNKQAPESTKEAFLKSLCQSLKEGDKGEVVPVKTPLTDTQLSFDLGPTEYKKAR